MEILALHPGALGDIILSLPALAILRDRYPDARITLAADTDFAVVAASGYAERILSISSLPLHRLFGTEDVSLDDERFWHSYDRIVSWTGSGHESFAARLARLHPHVVVGGWKPGIGEQRHVARLFLDSLKPWLTPPSVTPVPHIQLAPSVLAEGKEWLREQGWHGARPLFAIHPGAGSAAKRWPLSNFGELARGLSVQGDLLIIEGPAEPGSGRGLAAELGAGARLACNLPLPGLAAALAQCRAFVGNDSGIAHLAAGIGIPCVVLFGPTSPQHWAPLGSQVSTLRDDRDCHACKENAGDGHTCLENIPVQVVQAELLRLIS